MAKQDRALLVRVGALHPHAFRHAFGTHATEAGVPVDVLQSYMGHATPATTALYNKAGVRRRQAEIGKLFRPSK
ncbi:tyrosine-type recombinase/integrase [Cupriavidus necator]